jgi:predicted ABC-type ATPase
LNGVEFNPVQGGFSINYEDDIVYQEFKKQLKEREELLKIAQKSTIFDAYGNEVPKVSTTPRKSSITIKF